MTIEFKYYDTGMPYFNTVGLNVEIRSDGAIAGIYGDIYIDELEQVLAKMKELQNGKDNTISS